MATTEDQPNPSRPGGLVHKGLSPVETTSFVSALDTPEASRKLVEVKAPKGMVDMFGRLYPKKLVVWVHHFDDYGVMVEGTYDIVLARRALKKAGYDVGYEMWAFRCIPVGQVVGETGRGYGQLVGGRSAVAFYFDVAASL